MADPLGEVLRSVSLTGSIFLDSRFTAPWCVFTKVSAEDCKPYLTAPTQIIAYHFVLEGRLFISVGDDAIEAHGGEIVLLPRNDAHTLASGSGLEPKNARDLIQPAVDGGLAQIRDGGGGESVHLVCGFLAHDQLYNPLIAALPSILKIDMGNAKSRDWMETSIRFAASELSTTGHTQPSLVLRLSELLFIEAVRIYSQTLEKQNSQWLKGFSDKYVGQALALIHTRIRDPWSVESLAREVGLSRSAFIDRFSTLIGMPPIRYLTMCRLQTAKLSLRKTRMTIGQLASSVGYESEEAFSRAFKREFGLSPARWREQQ